jgi:hypothetical protein
MPGMWGSWSSEEERKRRSKMLRSFVFDGNGARLAEGDILEELYPVDVSYPFRGDGLLAAGACRWKLLVTHCREGRKSSDQVSEDPTGATRSR